VREEIFPLLIMAAYAVPRYGSVQLNALLAAQPTALETVVLTSFSANTSAVPLYETSTAYSTATTVFPSRFSTDELTNAYLVTLAPQTSQLNFLYYSVCPFARMRSMMTFGQYYTNAAANLARSTEQPVTQGVLFTFGSLPGPAPSYTGNVHVVTGEAPPHDQQAPLTSEAGDKDYIFCLGNCYAVPPGSGKNNVLEFVSALFPAASSFSTEVPANTGHGISAHTSAPAVYAQIQSYLAGVGF
jgi:hypothetical protein